MAFEVRIPSLGESVTEGTIVRWAKGDGEAVQRDETLLELETDKASLEIPADRAGVLHILKAEGATVSVGDVVARIDEAGAAARPAPAAGPPPRPISVVPPPAAPPPGAAATPPPASHEPPPGHAGPLSPAVRRLLDENRIDAGEVRASGRGGRITKGDVLAHLERRSARPAAPPPTPSPAARPPHVPAPATTSVARVVGEGEEGVPMSRIRKRIAERLVQAQQTAAILTTFNEVDMTAVLALRAEHRERFERRHGVGLGFMSFFGKACIAALEAFPAVNAEIRGDEIVYKHFVHLGVAVGTERGLVVPVVHHAERLSFAELEREIGRLAELARGGRLSLDDLSGGTFSISNGGVYGSLMSTPILNPPQSGILGMHKIEKRPVVVDDQIVIRPMMYLALSYDHRIVDGEQAVRFLVRVKECIEDPTRLLLGL
jgi:2-oxoglutarate dehydrogenase E2 component (dihydrolipoamide succinyltransferase)